MQVDRLPLVSLGQIAKKRGHMARYQEFALVGWIVVKHTNSLLTRTFPRSQMARQPQVACGLRASISNRAGAPKACREALSY